MVGLTWIKKGWAVKVELSTLKKGVN